jgi:hypothetical protein
MSTFELTISIILAAISVITAVLTPFVIAATRTPRTRRHPSL